MTRAAAAPSAPETAFARMVREGMTASGLGLRELCRAVRLDPSFLSKVLSGRRSPPSEEASLRQIAATLGLDAPRLIVAAGRIPSEWRRLWNDASLFASVHRLASAPSSAGAPPPRRAAPQPRLPAPEEEPRPGAEFGEELL